MTRRKFSWAGAVLLATLALAGCGGGGEPAGTTAAAGPQIGPLRGQPAPTFPRSLDGLQPTAPSRAPLRLPQADSGYSIDTTQREQVRLFYKSIYASSNDVASGWSGSILGCSAGDTTAAYKSAVLRRVNWYRAMAGVPAGVQLDATFSANAQQAALLMAANNALDHFPPITWLCYNATGGAAAGKSNLALGSVGPGAIDGYMRDPGANNTVVGHRRWVLYPQTQFMGTGDIDGTTRTNALWVQDAHINDARPSVRDTFVAWPSPGYAPYQVVPARWSFSYPSATFTGASVAMTQGGTSIPVRLETVANGYGENTLAWIPNNLSDSASWAQPSGDTTYTVTVSNVVIGGQARSFTYNVTVFDPDAGAPAAPSVTGSATATVGQAASFGVTAVGTSSSYQWRELTTTPYPLADTADSTANFTVSTTGGYAVVQSTRAVSGSAFHLAHVTTADQSLTLNQLIAVNANTTLSFASGFGLAGSGETAIVEVSANGGASWVPVFQQAGTISTSGQVQLPTVTFSTRTISLASFAGNTVQLRFRYAYATGGLYFGSASTDVGWYIDNISLSSADAATQVAGPTNVTGTSFSFTPSAAGTVLLQARAGMYGFWGDWGPALAVTASAATTTSPTAQADCLFGWAERTYPAILSSGTGSITVGPWYFRFYSGSGWYVGINTGNDHLYYLAPGGAPVDLGPKAGWFAAAGCQ